MAAASKEELNGDRNTDSQKTFSTSSSSSSTLASSTLALPCLKFLYLDHATSTQDEARRWLSENSAGQQHVLTTTATIRETETESTTENDKTATKDNSKTTQTTTSSSSSENSTSASSSSSCCCLAVMARQQSQGRGTSGRTWLSQRGNLFLTVAIPQEHIPVPLTLLPLQVGVLVARRLDHHLNQQQRQRQLSAAGGHSVADADSRYDVDTDAPSSVTASEDRYYRPIVTVKWPNDVLVNQQKIAGILIEHHYVPAAPAAKSSSSTSSASSSLSSTTSPAYWFLVGIGVNVRHAPSVPSDGPQRGRPSTCLYQHLPHDDLQHKIQTNDENDRDNDDDDDDDDDLARLLGQEISRDLVNWIYQPDDLSNNSDDNDNGSSVQRKQKRAQQVVNDWKTWAGLSQNIPYTLRETGEVVQVVDLEPDGQLRVWHPESRQERLLAADYLY